MFGTFLVELPLPAHPFDASMHAYQVRNGLSLCDIWLNALRRCWCTMWWQWWDEQAMCWRLRVVMRLLHLQIDLLFVSSLVSCRFLDFNFLLLCIFVFELSFCWSLGQTDVDCCSSSVACTVTTSCCVCFNIVFASSITPTPTTTTNRIDLIHQAISQWRRVYRLVRLYISMIGVAKALISLCFFVPSTLILTLLLKYIVS